MSSPHNATGYYTVYGEEALHADHFSTKLSFGDTQTVWARTGYLGFLRRTELTDASGGEKAKINFFALIKEGLLHHHTISEQDKAQNQKPILVGVVGDITAPLWCL